MATTPEQALMVQVQGMIAEYERAQTAERTRWGKRHRAGAGEVSVLGRAPHGYPYFSRAECGEAACSVVETEAPWWHGSSAATPAALRCGASPPS
ncbi:recombinase family protein [Streptomyces sp. NPDC004629]|uniref:recombinase family protein n=1 Tax=Streptomyces sp. NPDC004629 TaxID=3364705 RepID=UPI0036C7798C